MKRSSVRLAPAKCRVSHPAFVLALVVGGAALAHAQVYQTQPDYRNPVKPGAAANTALATPVSGSTYSAANRPVESGSGRFQIAQWSAGMPFSSSPPDFNFGDVIKPPPLTDLSKPPTVVTANGAFYIAGKKQLIAAQGGACIVHWPTLSGGTNTITYTLGSIPTIRSSRLFWTDNFIQGAPLNTNLTSVPDNTDYAVSLSGVYAKIHYNISVPDFDLVNSQDTPAGRAARSDNAASHLDLPAVWIDGNSVLRARNQSGYFILEYFDTSGYANSVGYEVVYVSAARVYQSELVLGDRLLPNEGPDVAADLNPSTSKASDYVTQWSADGSHFADWLFATKVNSDGTHPNGDSSKTQILWQRTGNLQVVWPYEAHWYAIRWPGDDAATVFVFDPADPANSPAAVIPTNYTASVVWSETADSVVKADSSTSRITPVGEGRALIQYQNSIDVWFVPVRVAARPNGAYFSNDEFYWPMGVPLQPISNQPRLQFDGAGNYLSFPATLEPGLTFEMWIKPTSTSDNRNLAAFLDYPQQATVQAALSLRNSSLQLSVLSNPQRQLVDIGISNPNFESPTTLDSAGYATTIPGWTFTPGAGLNRDGAGPFADNGRSPNGGYVAFIQHNGSRLNQTVSGLIPGDTYSFSFAYNARSGNAPHLQAIVDGRVLFEENVSPVGGTAPYKTKTVSFVASAESAMLTLAQTASGDHSLLFDAIRVQGTNDSVILVSTSAIPANAWSHVALTKDPNGLLQLYINGVPDVAGIVTKFNAQPPSAASYAQVLIGKDIPMNGAAKTELRAFGGEVREIRIWSVAQSASVVRQNMSEQFTGSELNLAHLIRSTGEQSRTPADGPDGSTFRVPDLASGDLISGYGTPNTASQQPYKLPNRLRFDGINNWAEFPLNWIRSDNRTIEFWIRSATVSGSRSLMSIATATATNVQVGLVNGRIQLSTAPSGGGVIAGLDSLFQDTSYQIAVTTVNGAASVYVDGKLQATATLSGAGADSIGAKVSLAAGYASANAKFAGEFSDLRVYSPSRSASQLADDRTSQADFTDPDLLRVYDFDEIAPGEVSGESVAFVPDSVVGINATYHGAITLGSELGDGTASDGTGGLIRSGTGYHAGIYAAEGRIIPVNSIAASSLIEVWWNRSFTGPYLDEPLQIPSMVTRYRIMEPVAAPTLVIAGQNAGGFPIPQSWDEPAVYYENDAGKVGFNPNEEHALIMGDDVFALRWDLNQKSTSPGFVLLQYKDLNQGSRTFLQPIQIVATNSVFPNFDGSLLVGQLLQPPMPMAVLSKSFFSGPLPGTDPNERLFQDRNANWWARSAVSSGPPDSIQTHWFYLLEPGFGFYWSPTLGPQKEGDSVPFGNTTDGLAIAYTIQWPDVVPELALGQSLSDAVPSATGDGNLPAVTGQKSVVILYDEANFHSPAKSSSVLIDPTNPSSTGLSDLLNVNTPTATNIGRVYFTLLPPHLRERVSWDPLFRTLTLSGEIVRPVTGFPYLLPAWLSPDDKSILLSYGTGNWAAAVNGLRSSASIIPNDTTPFDTLVLTPTGEASGYVTLGMNTSQAAIDAGDPVSLYPIYVNTNILYTGTIVVLYSANKFDQYTTLRHSGDFGGDPSQYKFDWRYSAPEGGQVPTSDPAGWATWIATEGANNIVFGGPGLLTLKDIYFSCRWRCPDGSPNTAWSDWTPPAMVESWLTRAMDGINPFEQRVGDLANNHVDLTTSILSQAGKRFIGAVPLNMDNADAYGLIEIYETLLEQARNLSIDAGYSDDDVNSSLLESASKLNELYTMLGDEALRDSRDPMIAWGSRDLNQTFFGSRASSLFAFQGIVPSLLEEELALLRGLDDSTSTPVTTYPVYNRLYWNFTKGINSGEPAYALNYGIPDVDNDGTGSITEGDAARLYPQGHGDAYGHYLTALMEYYRLLNNTNFTWIPRAEVKTIGGVNVTFDYVDERKMAAAALQRGVTSVEILDLTYRRDFKLDPTLRGQVYADANTNRAWSAAEWASRSSQAVLYDWITINSLLPASGSNDPPQTISRGTVPELTQLAGLMRAIQDKGDVFDRGDSPLGVAASVVPFDLDPSLLDAGQSHFEQIYARAVVAMQSAYSVLKRASETAAHMRRQDVSLETFRYQVAQREAEYNAQLVDLYGSPYSDDIGPTGAYASGYTGADLYHYFYVDRDLFDPATAGAVTNVSFIARIGVTGDGMGTLTPTGIKVNYFVNSDGVPVIPATWTGRRATYGKIQAAIGDYLRSWVAVRAAVEPQNQLIEQLEAWQKRLQDHRAYSEYYGAIGDSLKDQQDQAQLLQDLSDSLAEHLDDLKDAANVVSDATQKGLPQSFIAGLAAGGDLSFPARLGIGIGQVANVLGLTSAETILKASSYAAGKVVTQIGREIEENEAALQDAEYQSQAALELSLLLSRVNATEDSVYAAVVAMRQAWQAYTTLVTKGNQIQTDLVAFRAANAARIQEARYADVIFRTFKNEDLEQYRNAFDQAARYAFAASQVYDYETGLLDPAVVSGRTGDFMGEIMAARQLGDMVNGAPMPGNANARSLADVLDRMRSNWSAIKGRFSINNPTLETHVISMRQELFRIGNSTNQPEQDANDSAWQNRLYSYKVADIRDVPEFKNYCQAYSPMAASEPALVIPFSTEITASKNVFGLPLAGGDTLFDPAHFTTKIRAATVALLNYKNGVGERLTKSPRVYLVPTGIDRQRTPLSGGTEVRDWHVVDQVWPIPYPSAANAGEPTANIGDDNVHVIRRFAPMRAYDETELTSLSSIPYDSRLIGRSVWNTRWVMIIPASSLSSDAENALNTFVEGVKDIKLLLKTYSYSGN